MQLVPTSRSSQSAWGELYVCSKDTVWAQDGQGTARRHSSRHPGQHVTAEGSRPQRRWQFCVVHGFAALHVNTHTGPRSADAAENTARASLDTGLNVFPAMLLEKWQMDRKLEKSLLNALSLSPESNKCYTLP